MIKGSSSKCKTYIKPKANDDLQIVMDYRDDETGSFDWLIIGLY